MAHIGSLKKGIFGLFAVVSTIGLIAGCSGGGTDDGATANTDSIFVPTDGNTGTFTLNINSNTVAVSQTTGFTATIKDVNGNGVSDMRVTCDTERGLALIEPTSGIELSDGFGSISGVIGCEAPGSFRIGCRLPVGVNKRAFETVVCTGAIPAGFEGFPEGSGGGGLNGGVATNPGDGDGTSGGTGTNGFRVTSVALNSDGGGTSSFSADVIQDTCDPEAEPIECEQYSDDLITFQFVNNTNQIIIVNNYTYSLADSDGSGTAFTSKSIALGGVEIDANGGTASLTGLFLDATANGGDSCPGTKRFADNSSDIPSSLGFQNVTFRINASNEFGEDVTVVITSAFSFKDFDNC